MTAKQIHPYPWYARNREVYDRHGSLIARVWPTENEQVGQDTAKIMAEAPKLLEMLEVAILLIRTKHTLNLNPGCFVDQAESYLAHELGYIPIGYDGRFINVG